MTSLDTQCREIVESGRMERGAGRSVRFNQSQAKPEETGRGRNPYAANFDDAGSRPVAGRSATATSERMDVTAGRDPQPIPQSDGAAIGAVKGKARLPDAVGVDPAPSELIRKPDCLKPQTCNLGWTAALCWQCNDAVMRRKAEAA